MLSALDLHNTLQLTTLFDLPTLLFYITNHFILYLWLG